MNSDEFGQQLHDKATRGVALTAQEQSGLQAWYAQQDSAEKESSGKSRREESVRGIHDEVAAAISQLGVVTRRVQEISAANEALRKEVNALKRRVAQLPPPKSA